MKTFDENVAAARKRVQGMDKVDGFADRDPATILAALKSGIALSGEVDTAIFDAYVMLQDVVNASRRR